MKDKQLMVLEVSQKQSYIFNEKKLRNNILASDTIAYVTSSAFFSKEFSEHYNEEKNMVYAGGGHTFLIFDSAEEARSFAKKVSAYVLKEFPGLELFIKSIPYLPDEKDQAEYADFKERGPAARVKKLTNELEKKKGLRQASFFQATFGIENASRRRSTSDGDKDGNMQKIKPSVADAVRKATKDTAEKTKEHEMPVNVEILPAGYSEAKELENLCGEAGSKHFIAVVHIDGNQMGSRVLNLSDIIKKEAKDKYGTPTDLQEFELWREKSREFSESIDFDFKKALAGLYEDLSEILKDGTANGISGEFYKGNTGERYFPLRKIIAAGDDICFITDGRIGIECAVRFIRHLEEQKNSVDGKGYQACAGVAIVHQKYPFYRAYELAEELCSNAKKIMTERIKSYQTLEGGKTIPLGGLSAVDWHIEYGEMMGDLNDIRNNMTDLENNISIIGRPYQLYDVSEKYPVKYDPASEMEYGRGASYNYKSFKRLALNLLANGKNDSKPYLKPYTSAGKKLDFDVARNKQKAMRNAIKEGDKAYSRFIAMNRIKEDLTKYAKKQEVFDALEALDLYLPLGEE